MPFQPTVLIVDDRPANLLSLEVILKQLDIIIRKASSGSEALGLLMQYDFALVLLDVQMPDMDGFEVAELMRSNSKTSEIPIIFITAINKDQQHLFKGYECGAVDYIFKPIVDPLVVIRKVSVFCDLHKAKREAQQVARRLRKSEKQWQLTFDAMSDLVVIQDVEYRLIRVNQAVVDFCNIPREAILGRQCFECLYGQSDPCEGCPVPLLKKDLQPHTVDLDHAKTTTKYQLTVYPVLDDENNLSGIVHIDKDISEQIKMERQVRQTQKMQSLGTLAGGIAHDFNNILTPISGYASLLRMQVKSDVKLQQGLDIIIESADRAAALTQQILSFSRHNEVGRIAVKLQPIITEVLSLLRSTLPSTIEIRQDIDKTCGSIMADPSQVHQLLMNLCTNSSYAMHQCGGVLAVGLHWREIIPAECSQYPPLLPGRHLCVEVADTGCGVEGTVLDSIFDPYFTTKEKGKGTGLGLAMVHSIVAALKGYIQVESEIDQGTTFRIFLPVEPEDESPEVVELEAYHPLPDGGGEHILVVDDEEPIVKVHRAMLETLGYKITTATSSRAALELYRHQADTFDLVLTDMTMPEMTGAELAQEIMAMSPDMPVVICTGFSEILNAEQAKALGIRAYLGKPVGLVDLAQAVRQALG